MVMYGIYKYGIVGYKIWYGMVMWQTLGLDLTSASEVDEVWCLEWTRVRPCVMKYHKTWDGFEPRLPALDAAALTTMPPKFDVLNTVRKTVVSNSSFLKSEKKFENFVELKAVLSFWYDSKCERAVRSLTESGGHN